MGPNSHTKNQENPSTMPEHCQWYFETSKDALKAFSVWLLKANSHKKEQSIEISKNLKSVWKLIDKDLQILPSSKLNADSLEDDYFSPIFK